MVGQSSNTKIKILSVDGGGMKGIVTSRIIEIIEFENKVKFSDYFDIFIGVSTGSIISTLLFLGFSGFEIVKIYEEFSKIIFFNKSIIPPKYSIEKLNILIYNILISKKDVIKIKKGKKLSILTYNKTYDKPEIFEFSGSVNIKKLADAITASCAAPHYFSFWKINDSVYIDGSVVAQSPVLSEFSKYFGLLNDINKIKILSMGNVRGNYVSKIGENKINNLVYTYLDTLDIVFDSTITYLDSCLKMIYKTCPNNYLKIEVINDNMNLYLDSPASDFKYLINQLDNFYNTYLRGVTTKFFGG